MPPEFEVFIDDIDNDTTRPPPTEINHQRFQESCTRIIREFFTGSFAPPSLDDLSRLEKLLKQKLGLLINLRVGGQSLSPPRFSLTVLRRERVGFSPGMLRSRLGREMNDDEQDYVFHPDAGQRGAARHLGWCHICDNLPTVCGCNGHGINAED